MPGKDEQAGGIPVQAVDGPVGEGFPFLAVIPGHGIGQGIVIMTLGRVDGDPGRLVDHQYILILIYNGEGKVNRDNGLGRGLFRKHYF